MAQLERRLGWPSLTLYGVGMILGAGIYSVIGAAAGEVGTGLYWSFALAALVALPTALSYAELSTAWPEAGAEYVYLRLALPRWPTVRFVVGALVAFSGIATAATVSIGFGGYFSKLVDMPVLPIAAAMLAVMVVLNLIGLQASTPVNTVLTLIETSGLVIVAVLGVGSGRIAEVAATPPSLSVVAGASVVFFSFLGFENIANLSEETKDPGRSLPRAILVSLVVATALYVLVAMSAVALLPAEKLAASSAPLSDAVGAASPGAAKALSVIALFATSNTALISVMVAARLLLSMARSGDLPKRIASVHEKRKSPWPAVLVTGALAAALLPLGKVALVGSVSAYAALAAFAAVNVAVIVLRFREAGQKRPFRVPLSIGKVPVPAVFGALASVALLVRVELLALAIGVGFTVVAAAFHLIRRRVAPSNDHGDESPTHSS